jgi:hypothetical protein
MAEVKGKEPDAVVKAKLGPGWGHSHAHAAVDKSDDILRTNYVYLDTAGQELADINEELFDELRTKNNVSLTDPGWVIRPTPAVQNQPQGKMLLVLAALALDIRRWDKELDKKEQRAAARRR